MNRRGFLSLLGVGGAGMVLDPELALWVPGRKSFFFVQTPVRGLTLSQLVAVTYDKVLKERNKAADQWADTAILRYLEQHGAVVRV